MKLEPRLTGEAATLARPHASMLERLPATFHASILIELEKWSTLFDAERAYQRALLEHLAGLPGTGRDQLFAAVARVEAEAGVDRIVTRAPGAFQDEAQGVLRRRRLLTRWRQDVDAVFQAVQPALDAQLHPADGPRRLVVQIYARDIAVQGRAAVEPLRRRRRADAADAGRRPRIGGLPARPVRRRRRSARRR